MLTPKETRASIRAPSVVLVGLTLAALLAGNMFARWYATVADARESLQQALAGRYVIERELGHGGSASVYLARDLKIPRLVALKVLTPELALTVRIERFKREIAFAAGLNHPHILPLFEADEASGFLFYTMPPAQGESLGVRLSRVGPLPLDEALSIAGQIAEALEYAHGAGVIHRDIKPANILRDPSGHIWVADFGIALAIAGEGSEPLTETGSAMGTAAYMSPEQISGAVQLDGQTDVYSLGCVLYEMLVGAPPYTGPTVQSVLAKQLVDPIPPIGLARPDVPSGIVRIVERALAKDPRERFRTAAEFRVALAAGRPPRRVSRSQALTLALGVFVVAGMVFGGMKAWPRPSGVGLDSLRYVVLPLDRADGVVSLGVEEEMLQDAVGRWSGVQVVEASEVKDALAQRGSSPLTGRDARAIATASHAARFIRGEISRVGDSLRLHAVVRATASGTVLADGGVVKLSLNLAHADSALGSLAERLLFGEETRKDRLEDERGTRSYLARKAMAQGFRAVDQWNLAASESTFVTATQHDPDYPHALFWVAQVRYWNDAPLASWRASAERAALRRDRLSGRERTLLNALLAFANGDIAAACREWDRATVGQSNDFSAWYGLATCLARDSMVLRDAKSPTGWRFRSSYYRATKAYARAFQQLPPIHKALSAGSYAAVRKVLITSGSAARPGRALPPDTTTFAAYPSWRGDTLAFFPLPQQDFHGPEVVPEGMQLALHQERELFRELATAWVSDYPHSFEAMEALALSLEMLGDPGAIDTMKRARALSSTPEDSVHAAIAEVWMRVKFSAPRDLAGLSAARALADSLLLGTSLAGTHDPVLLSSLAALTGRAQLAASLSRHPAVVAEWGVPPPLVKTALPLLAFASLGGPADSLRDLEEQVSSAIAAHLVVTRQQRARMQWLGRPAALAFPDYRFKSLSQLAGAGNYLVDMEAALLRGDSNLVRHAFAELRAARRFLSPSDLTPDALYPETWLLAQLGDPQAANAWIDPTLRALSATAPETFTNPANAGALVQAMALRADLASQAGDHEVAKRWAAAVVVLWGGADPFLQLRVRRMADLAAGLSQAR